MGLLGCLRLKGEGLGGGQMGRDGLRRKEGFGISMLFISFSEGKKPAFGSFCELMGLEEAEFRLLLERCLDNIITSNSPASLHMRLMQKSNTSLVVSTPFYRTANIA
jgi:hypothetical protein